MPAAELSLVYQRVTADAGPLGDESASETNGALVLIVGFVFNELLAVGPSVYIPLGAEG